MDFRFCVQKRKVPDYRASDCKMPGLHLAFSQAAYSGVKVSSTIEDEKYPVRELFSRSGERRKKQWEICMDISVSAPENRGAVKIYAQNCLQAPAE